MRLSTRIVLVCAAAVLPSLAIQAWNEVALRHARIAEVRAEASRFALQSAAEVNRLLEAARSMLAAVGEAHLRNGQFPGCGEGLTALRARVPRYVSIAIVDPEGRVVCSTGGPGMRSVADRAYFRDALARRDFTVGVLIEGRLLGQPLLPVALPVMDTAGRIAAIAIAAFDTTWLSANLAASRALPPGGSVTVADRAGVIVARAPQPDRFVGTRIPDAFLGLVDAQAPGVTDVTSQDGTRRVLGYVPVGASPEGLYVSAGFASETALVEVDAATRRAALLILAGFLSALAAAWAFSRLALRGPVDRLLADLRRWTAGDSSARTASEPSGTWEIGRLAVGFNTMAAAVQAREQALRDSEARLRAVLGQMPVAVLLAEIPSGREVFRNARAAALLPPSEALAGTELAAPLRRAVDDGAATEGLDLPLRRPDGSETVLSVSAAPVLTAGGQRLAVAAFLDIGARRHAERQQELLTAELRHRVKNALAVVQAVAAQTLARSTSLEEFRRTFGGRIAHLARAQDALFAAADGRVRLAELLHTTLAPFGGAVEAEGPEVALPPRQTLAVALVLHELATNAAKHGALRGEGEGRLVVRWAVRGEGPEETVELEWQEIGTLPIEAPSRQGFGGRLIERCVAHDLRGQAEQQLRPDGLTWRLRFPRLGPVAMPVA